MLSCNTATVQELQVALDQGAITSVALVEQCLNQINHHNHDGRQLHAIISTPTHAKLVAIAASLDNERKNGDTRSPLHGIPIIIKVSCFSTISILVLTYPGQHLDRLGAWYGYHGWLYRSHRG